MIEAARLYEKSHEGLRLRWMNILYELGQQAGTNTIMFGFKELLKGRKENKKKEEQT